MWINSFFSLFTLYLVFYVINLDLQMEVHIIFFYTKTFLYIIHNIRKLVKISSFSSCISQYFININKLILLLILIN